MIVADVNILAYLLIDGPFTELAEQVHALDPGWIVPPLWRYEFINICATSAREKVISESQAVDAVVNASAFVRESPEDVSRIEVLELAIASRIATYDCEYVVLARKLLVPLVTNDKQVLKLFPKDAVSMADFIASRRSRETE